MDADHNELVLVPGENSEAGKYLVQLPEGGYGKPKGPVHARCRGCEVRCGLTAHGMMKRREMVKAANAVQRPPEAHTPFPSTDRQCFEVLCGDARDVVRSLDQVHCVLTSPPYYGLKTYGNSPLEIGHEKDVRDYIESLCEIFDAIPLHELGSLWVNLDDKRQDRVLLGIPHRFVVAMQDRGWKPLDTPIWAKSALLPDGTTRGEFMMDPNAWRLNANGFENMFRFSRTDHPWFDPCATLIPRVNGDGERYLPADQMILPTALDGRMPPNVWLFGPARGGAAHVAPMPEIVVEIPIALSCPLLVNPDGSLPHRVVSRTRYDGGRGQRRMGKYTQPELLVEGGLGRNDTDAVYVPNKPEPVGWTEIAEGAEPGIVCDPFCGVGTTGVVALRLGRSFIGCDLYDHPCQDADRKLASTQRRLSGDECAGEPVKAA